MNDLNQKFNGMRQKMGKEKPPLKELETFQKRGPHIMLTNSYVDKGEWHNVDKLLKHEDGGVRSEAAEVITHYFIDRKEWNNVEGWLKHTDANVRDGAARALTYHFIDREEWDKVGELLKSADVIKYRAVISLHAATVMDEIDPTPVLPALIPALKDKDPWVRYYTVDILSYTSDSSAVASALISALKDESDHNVRKLAAYKLREIAKANGKTALDLVKESGGSPEVEKLIKEHESKKSSEKV